MNPFIPINNSDIAIIDARAREDLVEKLKSLNICVIKTVKCHELQEGVSYHPDMVIHPINQNLLVVAPNVFDYYDEMLSKKGIIVVKGEKELTSKYPDDIAYNVGRLRGFAIHNFIHTDEKLKWYLKKENIEFIDVKQGYSKCSLAIIDESSGITSDKTIFESLSKKGMDILKIEPGHINLEGYKYGFIGGATGNYSKTQMFFTGKFDRHPDHRRIETFLRKRKVEIIYLSDDEIMDLGTIITLNNC
ncbi:hypothetical protein E9840_11065 [Tissierella creatinini]|nr:hypothetical protein E9840_11065 [Tissierella creatinini]TJX63228.1 hypothetical protein E8P77_15600 [Soehngenia saccharolytica]